MNGAQQGFNQAIDFGLHGDVHVYTGNTQNMGVVPWAAYDPIFYLHHCQIDRLWASWNAAGRKNPNFGTTKFVFANDKGQRVERLANDFLDLSKLDYKYDHLEPVTNPCPVSPAAAVSLKVATRTTPVPLGPGPVKMTMAAPPGPQAAVPLPTRVEKMSPNHRLYLVLRNLMTTGQPGVPYDLYLQVANGAATDDLYVGTINFFEFEHMHAGTPPADRFYSFDITDLAKRLQKAKKLTATPELTIVPGGKPAADAKPVIGEVSIVEQ
jgi:tyrosinase